MSIISLDPTADYPTKTSAAITLNNREHSDLARRVNSTLRSQPTAKSTDSDIRERFYSCHQCYS